MKEYKIGDIVDLNEYTDAALWCIDNNATLTELEPDGTDRQFEIVAIPEHEPTREEQRQNRAEAYRIEKDPITCQIQSLRDEEQTPEIEQEIADLIQERAEVVADIQARYPYPEDESN